MEQRRNACAGETGDPRGNPLAIEPGSPTCESTAGTTGPGKREPPRKPARQSASSGTRSHMRKCESGPAGDLTRFAMIGGEQANRSATAGPGLPALNGERYPNILLASNGIVLPCEIAVRAASPCLTWSAQKDIAPAGNSLDYSASRAGPYFDKVASKNVTALLGKTAYLNCRVKNLGNKTMSRFWLTCSSLLLTCSSLLLNRSSLLLNRCSLLLNRSSLLLNRSSLLLNRSSLLLNRSSLLLLLLILLLAQLRT
ncbi:hypothetical protein PR048_023995 [Dryococelus australis]|uniref:Ig-like domain-containing protein n=1 Tax=Dryococelus australis TaxID=614101 RepID=A0ABQ9GVN4_9NEOP|nr:hypothetical protein PR048_023995 [Dryococelus australis]